ncbi:uncharacterized protein PG986_012274 [Apiospora aurea]|uniref:Uncharacterized protein n=1 Tax=Apiospora aurea TaxID=335848 RepID=A0ABR1Q0N6_9PEZI
MDTSSPTALAMYEAACRPHSGAARRPSPGTKGTPPPSKLKESGDNDKAVRGMESVYMPEDLKKLAPFLDVDSWIKQYQKQRPRKQVLQPRYEELPAPRKPKQSSKTTVRDVKMDETPRSAKPNRTSAVTTAAAPEKQSGNLLLPDPVPSTDRRGVPSYYPSHEPLSGSQPECGTLSHRKQWASSKHEADQESASSTSVALPATPMPYAYVPHHLRGKQELGAPSPAATVAAPVSRATTKEHSAPAKPHDTPKPHDNHNLAKDARRQEGNTASRVNNSLFRDSVFGKNRCGKKIYSQADEDVFNLLDEPHVTTTNANTTTITSIQAGTTVGPNSHGYTRDGTPWPVTKCQPPPKELPVTNTTTTQCPATGDNSGRGRNNVERDPWAPASQPRLKANRVPDIACTAPASALRTTEGTSTTESASENHSACRSGITKNPTVFSYATPTPPRRSSVDEESQESSAGLWISEPGITTIPTTASAPEPHRSYPLSPEETDHYLRSLSTNDLIALSTKAQCELQERGRSFSSILSGVPGDGSGTNHNGVSAGGGEAATQDVNVGVGIGSGRAYKEKRKHEGAGSDTEDDGGATTAKKPEQHQKTEQKNKKQKSEQVVVSARDTDSIMYPASVLADSPSLPNFQLLQDESVNTKEASANDQQLEREDATPKTELTNTIAIATAPIEPLSINQTPATDKADDTDWHYVEEDCWMSPQPCCGDVFEMVDRRECH